MSEDEELEKLRKKRLAQFEKRVTQAKEEEDKEKSLEQEQKEKIEEKEESKLKILKMILFPDAYDYFINTLKVQYPKVADKITDTLIYLVSQNQLETQLSKNELIVLQRKILGIGPNIKVKTQHDKEAVDFAKKLKGED